MAEQTQPEREALIKSNLETMLPGNAFTVHLSGDDGMGEAIDVEWTGNAERKQVAKWLNEMSAVGKWDFS